jgi:glycosyltransferase involved in cell wall biosynthesis
MKIVRIIARLNIGGPAIHVALVNSEMVKRGHTTLLLAGEVELGEGDMTYFADALGVPVTRIETLGRRLSPSRDALALKQIVRILRCEKPDVVHTHTAKAGTLGRIAALMANIPCIVHTFHGNVLGGYFSPAKTAIFQKIERALARRTDRVITITPQQKEELTQLYRLAPPEKVEVIRLGFDLEPFLNIQPATVRRERCRAVWVGRLTAVKDPLLLLRSAALTKDIDVDVVGGGEMLGNIEASIESHNLSNVHLAGWQQNMPQIYQNSDFTVLTSVNEGTPVALIEAMASGLPVVATRVGGVPDLMLGSPKTEGPHEIYDNGLLVRDRQPQSLARAMEWLAAHPDERRQMGCVGREFVARTYRKDRLIDDLERLYRSILARKGISAR